jgi:restriction system protein
MVDQTLWGIHGGRTGDADALFRKRGVIALGWSRIPDLRGLAPTRDEFKRIYVEHYPETTPGGIAPSAGQLFRFVHEMKPGDLVAYASKRERQIHVGRVTGDYFFDENDSPGYPHRRPVTWIKAFPRSFFSQGALYEIGAALSFFQIRNYVDEYLVAIEAKAPAATPVSEDETVQLVANEIEESTRDFVLKSLAQHLKGHPFAHFIAHLLILMGYRTRVSDEGPDGGIDIIAHRDELGFEPPFIKVQVKSSEGNIGDPAVSSLYGKVAHGEYGLFVTLGAFTSQARNFARSKSNLRLIDGEELVDLIFRYYERFESRYRALLPLQRVWVPQRPEDTE